MAEDKWNVKGLRGSVLEELINYTNEKYRQQKLALVQKIPTSIKPVRFDKTKRHITLAYFDQKSTVDYIGVVQGIPICFDAKECAKDIFPLQNIHEHQVEFMRQYEEQGGISFLLIYFTSRHVCYYMSFQEMMKYWNRAKEGGVKQNVLEAERNVDKTKKESRFNASVNASIGFNQVADNFGDVYHKPMQQDLVAVSVSIPLLDWGVRKGKYNMARNNLNVVKISARQDEISIEEEVIMTVSDFNIQQQLIASAEEALDLSILAYNETKQRFIIGKADINSLTLSLNRQQQAQRNFISALQNYWLNYYKIRRLTLFDFATKLSLSDRFDFNGGKLIK